MPRRPSGPRRPSKPTVRATPASVPQSRSHAQQLRHADSHPSFQTQIKRQAYWNARLAAQAQETEYIVENDLAALDSFELRQLTQFETANIHTATLQSPDPNVSSGPGIAGIGESGFLPPPPPGA